MKKTHKHQETGMAIGMCLGISMGLTLGESLFGSMSLGMSFGLCIGMLIGMTIGMHKDSEVNKQLEEQNYTVKEIIPEDDGKYCIVVVNKNGEEKRISIEKGDLEAEQFTAGDSVFIDDEGNIELVFDKDSEDNEEDEEENESDDKENI